MTDETRAELRRGIEMLLAYAASLPADPDRPGYADVRHNTRHVMVEVWLPSAPQMHHLTTAQQLALSVLLGDESVLPQALADYMIESGHEYASECYEKGKRDGNLMAEVVKGMAPAVSAYADACRSLVSTVATRLAITPAATTDYRLTPPRRD